MAPFVINQSSNDVAASIEATCPIELLSILRGLLNAWNKSFVIPGTEFRIFPDPTNEVSMNVLIAVNGLSATEDSTCFSTLSWYFENQMAPILFPYSIIL